MQSKYIVGSAVALTLIVAAGLFLWKDTRQVPVTTAQSSPSTSYQHEGYSFAWLGRDGRLSQDGQAVLALLAHADEEGLPPARYRVPTLTANTSADDRTRFTAGLTQAALAYAHDMRFGLLDPQKLFSDVSIPAQHDDVAAGLAMALQKGAAAAYLRGLEPPVPFYARLKAELKRYRALAARPWPPVTAGSDNGALAARLQAEGWLDQKGGDAATALKQYQTASGLPPSGRLDDKTIEALNIPASQRADQIAVNMERWRWVPRALGDRYIMVNVPSASLMLVENGAATINSRVVVGAPDKPTPILVTEAVAVTINPVWHVPKSIVEKEIQPKLAENASYLDDKGMVEKDGEITQPPGPMNALGAAKFEMPNPFDVYLHDTPAKHAFVSDERALSHGCVRVEQIRPLVETVLGISDDALAQQVQTGDTQRRPLKAPVPVLIEYWTVVASGNAIGFQPDVYGRDRTMIAALQSLSPRQNVAQR